ncbi:hypothetical protein E3226_000155 [Legionella geestiana]|uniref:hypothetical protein n=1 Tax=Legionella geestiana TaxID=45065 RepID=UPI001091EAC0|nr:hypothetical protein [Legionella geestiana]QDQ38923.1 hypothetical protein E3226_000155 [Legionella geestiana]
MKISIKGLNRSRVLVALYDRAINTAPSASHQKSLISERIARADSLLSQQACSSGSDVFLSLIDLGDGSRTLCVTFSENAVNVNDSAYNTLYGKRAAEDAITQLYSELPEGIDLSLQTIEHYEALYSAQFGYAWKTPRRSIPPFNTEVFEKFLIKTCFNTEAVTPVIVQYSGCIQAIAKIYASHGFDASKMLTRHLVQLVKSTGVSSTDATTSLCFHYCLDYIAKADKQDSKGVFSWAPSVSVKAIPSAGTQLAPFLSAAFYARNYYAFDAINSDLFSWWIEHNPIHIIDILKAILILPKSQSSTPINDFFSRLSVALVPDDFYDRMAVLFINHLINASFTPEEFITVYMAVDEQFQNKILSTLLIDQKQALIILKKLFDAQKADNFSTLFPRRIIAQLKILSPATHQYAENEQWCVTEDTCDSLESDLTCLEHILDNQTLTHDERQRDIYALNHLQAALECPDSAECVLQMFEKIPLKHWGELFILFGVTIVYSRFPATRSSTSSVSDTRVSLSSAINPWLSHPDKWETVLYGCLEAVLHDLTTQKGRSGAALGELDRAFFISEKHVPGLSENVLKRFFLEKAPASIKVFMAINDLLRWTSFPLAYFSQDTLYMKLASFLPEDTRLRAQLLADLFRYQRGFAKSLEYPFVRNNEELCLTAITLMQNYEGPLLNLFQMIPSHRLKVIFSELHRQSPEEFLMLLRSVLTGLNASPILGTDYVRLVLMLLSGTEKSDIDVFNMIDTTPDKEKLVSQFLEPQSLYDIECYNDAYKWIFGIIHHYAPERLQSIAAQLILHHIHQDNFGLNLEIDNALQAILSVTDNTFVWPELEKPFFTDYVANRLKTAIKKYTPSDSIKALAHFLPNADRLLVSALLHTKATPDNVSHKNTRYLDDLVRIYGFAHLLALCRELDLTQCCTYLEMKFSACPELLEVTDTIVTACADVIEAYTPPINEAKTRIFFKNLHAAISETAKNCREKPFNIDVSQIAMTSGLPEAILSLLPDYRTKIPGQQSAALLLTNSWEKSGFTRAAASSSVNTSIASSSVFAPEPD